MSGRGDGGHTVGARGGQQGSQGSRPWSREGARGVWQTNTQTDLREL